MLQALDTFLLKKFQEYSEHQQVENGRNCYALAYTCYVLKYNSGVVLGVSAGVLGYAMGLDMVIFIALGYLLATLLVFHFRHPVIKKKYTSDTKIPEVSFQQRIFSFFWAVSWSVLPLFLLLLFIYDIGFLGLVFGFPFVCVIAVNLFEASETYFASCTPLPPEVLEARRSRSQQSRKVRSFRPQAV